MTRPAQPYKPHLRQMKYTRQGAEWFQHSTPLCRRYPLPHSRNTAPILIIAAFYGKFNWIFLVFVTSGLQIMGMCVMTFSDAGKSASLRRFICLDGSVVQTGRRADFAVWEFPSCPGRAVENWNVQAIGRCCAE